MSSICITVIGALSSEKQSFSRAALVGRRIVEQRGLPVHMCSAMRIGLSRLFFSIETTKANKNQQLTAGDFLAEATNINRNQQKSTESAKVSKNHQKSSEIITRLDRSHQKSSIIITNHQSQHVSLWFLNSVQCSSEQTAGIGT